MTARTLEEIEAEYAKGRGNGAPHMAPLGVMIDNFPHILAIAQEQRAEIAAKDKKILALRAESKMKDDAIQKIERQLQEANECRDPAYFAQIGRKRR